MADAPRGNASTEDWATYAKSQGKTEEELKGLNRDEIRGLFIIEEPEQAETNPNQEEDIPGQVEEAAESAAPDTEQPQGGPSLDFSKFTTGETAVPAQAEVTDTEAVVVPSVDGDEVWVDGGESAAIALKGTYQLRDKEGVRHYARKGDTVHAPESLVAHGVKLGFLARI